jgi:hypothetical protein
MSTIATALENGPLNLGDLRKVAGVKVEICSEAVRRLKERGHVQTSKGPNNSTLHELLKPYRLHEDPTSPLYYPLDAASFEVTE